MAAITSLNLDASFRGVRVEIRGRTRRPTNWWGSAKRDFTPPSHSDCRIIYPTCYHLSRKRSCITIDRDNNTTPAIYVMHRSINRLELPWTTPLTGSEIDRSTRVVWILLFKKPVIHFNRFPVIPYDVSFFPRVIKSYHCRKPGVKRSAESEAFRISNPVYRRFYIRGETSTSAPTATTTMMIMIWRHCEEDRQTSKQTYESYADLFYDRRILLHRLPYKVHSSPIWSATLVVVALSLPVEALSVLLTSIANSDPVESVTVALRWKRVLLTICAPPKKQQQLLAYVLSSLASVGSRHHHCRQVFAARRSGSFESGICHRVRDGQTGGNAFGAS